MASPNSRFVWLRKKAPQLIALVIVVTLAAYVVFEFLEDFAVNASLTSGPLVSAIMSLTHNVKNTVASWGYLGIFSMMALEASSLPVPSEVILPFSGYLVSLGQLDFVVTLLVATVAALVGSLVDYFVGLKGIEALTRYRILGRAIFSADQIAFAAKWFSKYGAAMIFLGRLVPGIRTLISFPAGATKMPLTKFLALTAAGCILWNCVLIYVGYYLGTNWTAVAGVSHYLLLAVVATLAVVFTVYLTYRRRKRNQTNRQ